MLMLPCPPSVFPFSFLLKSSLRPSDSTLTKKPSCPSVTSHPRSLTSVSSDAILIQDTRKAVNTGEVAQAAKCVTSIVWSTTLGGEVGELDDCVKRRSASASRRRGGVRNRKSCTETQRWRVKVREMLELRSLVVQMPSTSKAKGKEGRGKQTPLPSAKGRGKGARRMEMMVLAGIGGTRIVQTETTMTMLGSRGGGKEVWRIKVKAGRRNRFSVISIPTSPNHTLATLIVDIDTTETLCPVQSPKVCVFDSFVSQYETASSHDTRDQRYKFS